MMAKSRARACCCGPVTPGTGPPGGGDPYRAYFLVQPRRLYFGILRRQHFPESGARRPGFAPGQEKEFFNDMLEYLRERGAGASYDEFFSRLASSLACKSAVKAGGKAGAVVHGTPSLNVWQGRKSLYLPPAGRPIIHLSFARPGKKI